jgi:hypothetical protein
MSPLYIALVHHPVRDRLGETVTTAVTNLDVHDLARSARTYDLHGYFVVTPITAQQAIVERILEHWRSGPGKARIPARGDALGLVQGVRDLAEARAAIERAHGTPAFVVVTSAKAPEGRPTIAFATEAERLRRREAPTLLVFGTGHGLTEATVREADAVLAPIRPDAEFNHLSVRAAAAICLDRLLGDRGSRGAGPR